MKDLWISNSYAKINLGLHVLERLPNGYHRIETGFVFIDWYDRFEVQLAEKTQLDMGDSDIPADENNLILKAIKLLQNEVGLQDEFKITVQKNIPAGAGLGGGSSNAATILRMINKISNLGLSPDELAQLGKQLGADVPFFIYGTTGIGTGVGDEIEAIDIQPDAWIVTAYPKIVSRTQEAYEYCIPNPEPDFSLKNVLLEDEIEEWSYLLQNDLEAAVFPRYELVGNFKDQFYEFGASYAGMSGSGSSVFGLFLQDFVAIDAYESLHRLGFPAKLTRPGFKPDLGIYRKESL